jgi:hypothetical protein
MKYKLPSFLVIGVQKAATSWLWYCLEEHPDIFLPKKREDNYLGGEKYQSRGWEWWIGRFAESRAEQIVGDVSVDYIFNSESPKLIQEKLITPLFVISLRNPIDRAISAYFWNLRRGKIPFLELNIGLRRALAFVDRYSNKQEKIYANIIKRGFYDEQIAMYLQYFEMDRMLFLDFDKIRSKPLIELQKAYEFLGVNTDYEPQALIRQPKRNTYINPLIRLERLGHSIKLISVLIDRTNALLYNWGMGLNRPMLSQELMVELKKVYSYHNRSLLALLNHSEVGSGYNQDIINAIKKW